MARRSNDKAQRSHIERTVFVAPTVQAGDSIRYGDWQERETFELREDCERTWDPATRGYTYSRYRTVRGTSLTLIDLATGSDYSGTLVEASNARCLKRDFPWLVEVHGGHGTFGVAYLGKRENQSDALIEAIDSLASYPLYDEQDHSDLEHEQEQEQWESDGRDDFKRALVKHFDLILDEEYEHDLDDDKFNDAVDMLWIDCCEIYRGGESYLNEQGDSIYFPVYQLMKQISDSRFADYLDKGPYGGERGTIREQFAALCDASRVENSECDICEKTTCTEEH